MCLGTGQHFPRTIGPRFPVRHPASGGYGWGGGSDAKKDAHGCGLCEDPGLRASNASTHESDGAGCDGAEHARYLVYLNNSGRNAHQTGTVRCASCVVNDEGFLVFLSSAVIQCGPHATNHNARAPGSAASHWPQRGHGDVCPCGDLHAGTVGAGRALALQVGSPTSCWDPSGRPSLAPRPFFVLPQAPPCVEPQQVAAPAHGSAASHSLAEGRSGQPAGTRWLLGRVLRRAPGRAPPNLAAPGWAK